MVARRHEVRSRASLSGQKMPAAIGLEAGARRKDIVDPQVAGRLAEVGRVGGGIAPMVAVRPSLHRRRLAPALGRRARAPASISGCR